MEVLFEILGYAKLMKELVTKKRSMDFKMVKDQIVILPLCEHGFQKE